MKKQYNIMTSCDDNLAPYVSVLLTSIALNLKEADINFFFLHSRVSKKNIEMLKALCNKLENGKINFQEIIVPNPDIYREFAKYGVSNHGDWPGEAYYSICAHLLLPDNVDRILYLDAGDTLIIDDIDPYYNCDFKGKSLLVTGSRYKLCNGKVTPYTEDDLSDLKNGLPAILRGLFNSGSYMMNLKKMREDERSLADYQYLLATLQEIFGENISQLYFGDQGFIDAAFVGDIEYYDFEKIQNIWYMPYNFCLWYYDKMNEEPDYSPAILHFAGTSFKPWNGTYPIFLERFQKKDRLRAMKELKIGQAKYFYLWHEYAIITNEILDKMGF